MPRPFKMGITVGFLAGFAVLATLFVVGHVEGAKPAPAISLQASFEELWVTDEDQNEVNLYRMKNDVTRTSLYRHPRCKGGEKGRQVRRRRSSITPPAVRIR